MAEINQITQSSSLGRKELVLAIGLIVAGVIGWHPSILDSLTKSIALLALIFGALLLDYVAWKHYESETK